MNLESKRSERVPLGGGPGDVRPGHGPTHVESPVTVPTRTRRVFKPAVEASAETPAAGVPKKWLRAPVFGPAHVQCYVCKHTRWLGYFEMATNCPKCGERRYLVPED